MFSFPHFSILYLWIHHIMTSTFTKPAHPLIRVKNGGTEGSHTSFPLAHNLPISILLSWPCQFFLIREKLLPPYPLDPLPTFFFKTGGCCWLACFP